MNHYFPEPEQKREMARSIGTFDVDRAVEWFAWAELQESGGEEDYERAHEAWKAAEPQREHFATDESDERIEAFRAKLEKKRAYEWEKTFGGLFAQIDKDREAS